MSEGGHKPKTAATRKGKEMDFPLEPPKGMQPHQLLDLRTFDLQK